MKKSIPAMALIVLTLTSLASQTQVTHAQQSATFKFAFGGDTGYYGDVLAPSQASHQLIPADTDFFVDLGDISYNGTSRGYPATGNEINWCTFVKQNVNDRLGRPNYPYEMLVGNHEDGSDPQKDGYIGAFTAPNCLPNSLPNFVGSGLWPCTSACYGKEGYFDYPANQPIARFIMIANAIKVTNDTAPTNSTYIYDYCPLSACGSGSSSPSCPAVAVACFDQHYQWLKQTIDVGKAAGYWIILIQHKPCLVPDMATFCEGEGLYNGKNPGAELLSLEISEGVDLVLNGHSHIYARSKQITCYGTAQPNDTTNATYQSSCVANDGSNGTYPKGSGLVQIIQGDFSQRDHLLNFNRQEINYFATAMSANGVSVADCCWVNGHKVDDNSGNGIGVITVTPQSLSYLRLGQSQTPHQGTTGTTFSDSFVIGSPSPGLTNSVFWLAIAGSGIVAAVVIGTYLVARRVRLRKTEIQPSRAGVSASR